MKHAALAALALVFWPIQGTTHGWVWSALALAAIWKDHKHATTHPR